MPASSAQLAANESTTATTTVSFTAQPAGTYLTLHVAADDYITTSGANRPESSSWTPIQLIGGSGQFHGSYMWGKVAAGSETSVSYTIDSASRSVHVLMAHTGIDQTTPVDVSAQQNLNGTAATYTTPTVTPTTGDRWSLAHLTFSNNGSGGRFTGIDTWLNSYTEVADSRASAGPNLAVGVATLSLTGNGSTTTSSGATSQPATDLPQARAGIIAVLKVASSSVNGSVTAVRCVASAAVLPPVVTSNSTVTAVATTASAAVLPPVVAGVRTAAVVTPPTVASAAALPPAVTSNSTVTAVATTASAVVLPPSVSVVSSPTVVTPPTVASAAVLPPAVAGVRTAAVVAPQATAAAVAQVPVVAGEVVITGGGPATASAVVLPPVVTGSGSGAGAVVAVGTTAAAAVLPPAVSGQRHATVASVPVVALAAVRPPTVAGQMAAVVIAVRAIASATVRIPALPGGQRDITITAVTEPVSAWSTTDVGGAWLESEPVTAWDALEPTTGYALTEPTI